MQLKFLALLLFALLIPVTLDKLRNFAICKTRILKHSIGNTLAYVLIYALHVKESLNGLIYTDSTVAVLLDAAIARNDVSLNFSYFHGHCKYKNIKQDRL